MIKKSLLTALVLLVAYHLVLPHLSRKFYQIPGAQRGNYARVQHFLYDVPNETSVIVGSSMSLGLDEHILGPDYVKLTLPGNSIFTSLEIIRRSGKHPRLVLIETNQIFSNADPDVIGDTFSPWLLHLRRASPIFREEGRPANFANGIAEVLVRKSCQWTTRLTEGMNAQVTNFVATGIVRPEVFTKLLEINRRELVKDPSSDDLNQRMNTFVNYVDSLAASGSTCILYEMPVDSSLVNLPTPMALRKAMETRLPRDKYHWLAFPTNQSYETFDGIHLTNAALERFTKIFVDQVNQTVGTDESRRVARSNLKAQ